MAIAVVSLEDGASIWELGRSIGVTKMRYQTHPEMVQQVCPVCMQYQDTVWDIGDPDAPDPPLHPDCACQMIPEFEPGTVLGTDPDGEPVIADAPPALEPGEYLRRAVAKWPAARVDKVFGPSRGKLIRSKAMLVDDLVRDGELRKVDNLFAAVGVTREEFGAMTYLSLRKAAEARLKDRRSRRTVVRRTRPGRPQSGIDWTPPGMFVDRGVTGSLFSGEQMIARSR